jgi:hypothetical protein
LDCLPIAILHAAGVVEKRNSTFEEYLKRYEKDINIRRDAIFSMNQSSYAQTLTTVWALESLAPEASALLKVLALLDNDPIHESILRHGEGHQHMDAYPSVDNFDEVKPALSKASLIRRNKQLKTLSIHHVVQDVARQVMGKEDLQDAFEVAVALVNADWKEEHFWAFGHRLSDWQVADFVVFHVEKLAKHRRTHSPHTQTCPARHIHVIGNAC